VAMVRMLLPLYRARSGPPAGGFGGSGGLYWRPMREQEARR